MVEFEVILLVDVDLHVCLVAIFVCVVMRFFVRVFVVSGECEVDVKSFFSVLVLGVKWGIALRLCAEGEDVGSVIDVLGAMVCELRE